VAVDLARADGEVEQARDGDHNDETDEQGAEEENRRADQCVDIEYESLKLRRLPETTLQEGARELFAGMWLLRRYGTSLLSRARAIPPVGVSTVPALAGSPGL